MPANAKPLFILNGPNLNRLGKREPAVYGTTTLAEIEAACRVEAGTRPIVFRQSNSEAQLIDWIHEAGREVAAGSLVGIVFNAGAFTHTSLALHDAIKGAGVPVIEYHISNVHAREAFRHHSWLSPAAKGVLVGLGVRGYALGIEALLLVTQAKG